MLPSPKASLRAVTLFLFAAILAIGGASIPSAAEAQGRVSVGAVGEQRGDAAAFHAGSFRDLSVTAPILFDDMLSTGDAARLRVDLVDETAITLGENARVLIDRFVYDPNQSRGELLMHVVEGAFLFVSGGIGEAANKDVTIATSVGTLGIRGTTVWGGRLDGRFHIYVFDGEVEVTSRAGSVTLQAGEATSLNTSADVPAPPAPWTDAQIARAAATISF